MRLENSMLHAIDAWWRAVNTGSSTIKQAQIDAGRNERNEQWLISRSGSRPIFSFRTDEERMIARKVASLL